MYLLRIISFTIKLHAHIEIFFKKTFFLSMYKEYENNKQRFSEQARNKYRELPNEEKDITEYGRN